MSVGALKPRWGQPLTGIISFVVFLAIALVTWYIFSDPRGPVGWFPYPFVMYLAMMILVGIWQHMFLADWPFQKIDQPMRGIIMTIVNLVLVWFVIDVIFYRVLGIGLNFLSYYGLEAAGGKPIYAQIAVVCFVLIGFYTYPVSTIFFGKWPVQPSNIPQPAAGFAEFGWGSLITLFAYVILIVPFFGILFKVPVVDPPVIAALNTSWWAGIGGTGHVHWVFGWWEWAIIVLFMTANVWRMKPWSLITLPQPWKGLISVILSLIIAYGLALICRAIIPMWVPAETFHNLEEAKGLAEVQRFLWLHSAEIAGFTLIPFLIWHHYFDDIAFGLDKDAWSAFFVRTVGVLLFAAGSYWVYYYTGFGHSVLGNHHMEEFAQGFSHGESLVWNFWWIIPLLWNEWFFHKWPFYVHEK